MAATACHNVRCHLRLRLTASHRFTDAQALRNSALAVCTLAASADAVCNSLLSLHNSALVVANSFSKLSKSLRAVVKSLSDASNS